MTKLAGLINTNALWSRSGYGTQGKQLVSRMVKDGHAMAVSANYGLQGTIMDWEGVTHFPRGNDAYNNDVIGVDFRDWTQQRHPNHVPLLMTLYDVWVLTAEAYANAPVLSWVPIDCAPVAQGVAAFLNRPNVRPVAMSRFGQEQMAAAGIESVFIPHAIETDVFKRTELVAMNQGEFTPRQIMGVDPQQFVVGCFNANQDTQRKAWPEQLLAFSIFAQSHDDAVLYIHSERFGANGGFRMDELLTAVGISERQIRFVDQHAYRIGIPSEGMAALMSACDVGLASTYGEGFGLTVLELQACGTRVIANNFSAQPELVGDGWLTDGEPVYHPHFRSWWSKPTVSSIVECLEAAYVADRGPSDKARAHAVQYDADLVYRQKWRPLFAELTA